MDIVESQAKIPFELAAAMQQLGEKAQYVKTGGNEKNALDFHLAFYEEACGTRVNVIGKRASEEKLHCCK